MGNKCCRVTEDDNSPFGRVPGDHPIFNNNPDGGTGNFVDPSSGLGATGHYRAENAIGRSPFNTIPFENNPVTSICLWEHPQHGSRLVSGDANGNLHWSQLGTDERGVIEGVHERAISALCSLSNGMLATGSADKNINLISPKKMTIKASLTGHNFRVNALAAGSDPNILYSGARDGTVRVWDINNTKQIHSVWKEGNVVTSIMPLCAVGNQVGANCFYQTSEQPVVRLWSHNGGSLEEIFKFGCGPDPIVCCDMTRDGYYFAAGTKGFSKGHANVLVFDIRKVSSNAPLGQTGPEYSPSLLYKFEAGNKTVQAVKFVTASSCLAVCGDGAVVRSNFTNGSMTYLKDASFAPDAPLVPAYDPANPQTHNPEQFVYNPYVKHKGYAGAELDPLSYMPLGSEAAAKFAARRARAGKDGSFIADDVEDVETADEEEDDMFEGPSGVTCAFILPRLRKRRMAAYCADWPANSSQFPSVPNSALLITATPITASDAKGRLGGCPVTASGAAIVDATSNTIVDVQKARFSTVAGIETANFDASLGSQSPPPMAYRMSSDGTSLHGSVMQGQRSPTDMSPRTSGFGGAGFGGIPSPSPVGTGGLAYKTALEQVTKEGSVIRIFEAHEKKFYLVNRKSAEQEAREAAAAALQQQQAVVTNTPHAVPPSPAHLQQHHARVPSTTGGAAPSYQQQPPRQSHPSQSPPQHRPSSGAPPQYQQFPQQQQRQPDGTGVAR